MSKMSYHVNPETGRPNLCTATLRDCKFAVNGELPEHYETKQEAKQAAEKLMNNKHGITNTLTKNSVSHEQFLRFDKQDEDIVKKYFSPSLQRKMMTAEESNAKNTEMYKEYIRNLNFFKEIDKYQYKLSISNYSGYGYQIINSVLRFGDDSEKMKNCIKKNFEYLDDNDIEERIDKAYRHIDNLHNVINNSVNKTPEKPRTLYRYVFLDEGQTVEDYVKKNLKDNHFWDKSFLSTCEEDPAYIVSAIKNHKKENNQECVIFEMVSSKGISLCVKDKERSGDIQSFEKERLLPDNLHFKVVGEKTENLNVPIDRKEMMKHFNPYRQENRKISLKGTKIFQMIDEDLLKDTEDKTFNE